MGGSAGPGWGRPDNPGLPSAPPMLASLMRTYFAFIVRAGSLTFFSAALGACGSVIVIDTPGGGGGSAGASTLTTTTTTTTTSPPLPQPSVRLAQGWMPCCLKNAPGTVTCYHPPEGSNWVPGPADLPGITDATAVATADEVSCVLHAGGAVSCWGWSHEGQLGLAVPIGESSEVPIVLPSVSLVKIATGHHVVCGIEPSAQAVCWGSGYDGPLGDPAVWQSQAPVPVVGIADAVDIGVFIHHACAVRAGGSVWCWGTGEAPSQISGISSAVSLSVGDPSACAVLAGGKVVCWTPGEAGLLTVPGIEDAAQVSVSWNRACARRAGGSVACWYGGPAEQGELDEVPIDDAVDITTLRDSKGVCAIRATGEAVCWKPYQGSAWPFPG